MKRIFLCSILLLSAALHFPQVTEDWVKRYSGPEPNGAAEPQAIAADLNGNIYVIGSAATPAVNGVDYATIKYSNDGSVLWIKTYDGTNLLNKIDIATDVAIDNSGNVYVTGKSQGQVSLYDYATIKYNSNGDELWVQRYDTNNFDDEASSIAVDPLGNVYVTGWTKSSFSATIIYTTIKYSPDGNQLWVADYNGPGNGHDFARSIAVDDLGNVYVTGESMGINNKNEYATIKYDTNGNELWVKRYSGPENQNSMAYSLTIDAAGNVYVTGSSYIYFATIKYGPDGSELWVQRYGAEFNYDKARAFSVDLDGNVYVTGESYGSTSESDYATIKYNSSGELQWVSVYNGVSNEFDSPSSIAVDNDGNVYVTGWSDTITGFDVNYDFTTVKYNSVGEEVWVISYNGTGNGSDLTAGLVLDDANNVYITGSSLGNFLNVNYATIKYSQQTISTTLTMNAPAGTQVLEVASTNGFSIGDNITINPGGVTEETNTITGFGSIQLQTPLQFDHNSGEVVELLITSVEDNPRLVANEYTRLQNFPNPFNPATMINYSITNQNHVILKVYDVLGSEIVTLINEEKPAGSYSVSFDANKLSSGIYFYRLTAGNFIETKKMILLK
ncbi:MAG: SBBP repeat-containing protein [Ignavibacteria bacterium]|nr:SBBP repeat-containing protein [Ignavibacteria bacterium]